MPNLLKKRTIATDGTETGPSSSKKQRLIDATKTLLDIANESSDAFPPLKSCLGGINALIKYYEGCKDVEENLGDLVIWLTKLKDGMVTTIADENPQEVERREQLARSLESIEKRSRRLLEKGKGAKILDKRRDSGVIVKLVEELRQAILLYQLSQQRSIETQVSQLASSFNSFLKLGKKAPAVKEKIESVLARLDKLTTEGITIAFRDKSEFRRKLLLFESLEGIKDELRRILEQSNADGYKRNDADMHAVCELGEDVRDAVVQYQLAQQTAIYEQNCRLIDSADLSVLNNCRRAQAAEYRHGNRRGCLKGTRGTLLDEIESWANDFEKSSVYWLNGLAGTGKTTIAQTTAERLFAEGRLGASFFCSRDFEDRSDLHFIFPTLAFQLAHKYPDFRNLFISLLQSNPDVVHESLYSQMQKLIAEPLRETGISTVIVIDALDECRDDEPSSAILSVLARFFEEIPQVRFFITGRPEPRIETGFRLPLLADSTDVFVLHHVHPSSIENDIRIFLKHELSELAQRRQLEGWPSDEHINLFCRRAAGLFVYAVATVKFLGSHIHLTQRRLDAILKLPGSTAPEGNTRLNSNTTLDSLYTSILRTAFSEGDPEVYSKVRTTVGTIVTVVNPLPPPAIAQLTGLTSEEVMLYLRPIQSLLVIDQGSDQPVKPFHKSFPDFITDPSRCVDTRFHTSLTRLHLELTINCLRLMNTQLEQDLLSLPEYSLNAEIEDLQTRIDGRVSLALQYACRSWHSHLTETRGEITDVIPCLRDFLESKFLAWLEVLSVLGDMRSASVGLEKLMEWLQEVARDSQLLDTARDCFYFVTKFFEPINVSATHIYHSALELSPISSIIRKLYYDRCHGVTRFPRVVIGTPDSWDTTISVSGKHGYGFCTWSPCGQFIAAQTGQTVEIRNPLTFELLTILLSPKYNPRPTSPLAYSPDGRSLACGLSGGIIIWDIQTGGISKEIRRDNDIITSLVWSLDGRTIAITLESRNFADPYDIFSRTPPFKRQFAETYDIVSATRLSTKQFESRVYIYLWSHDETFRLIEAVPHETHDGPESITYTISEIGPTLIEIESSSLTMGGLNLLEIEEIAFSPSTYQISTSAEGCISVYDIRTSHCLLGLEEEEYGLPSSFQFSPDGSHFACCHNDSLRVFQCTSDSYILLWESLFSHEDKSFLQFSPNSSSILSQHDGILQVRRLSDLPIASETHPQYTRISRSGRRIATAHRYSTTVTIIDLHLRAPPQFIDTGFEVENLVITGNVLVAAGPDRATGWLLTEEGTVDGVSDDQRASGRDNKWTLHVPQVRVDFWNHSVEGVVGVVQADRSDQHLLRYHIETGDVIKFSPESQNSRPTSPQLSAQDGWLISNGTTPEAAWVIDPEGMRRFWVPVEWRESWDRDSWHHKSTTLLGERDPEWVQSVVIKF